MRGLTPEQIKTGLEKLVLRESPYPPNGIEFRQLCLPDTISPNGGNPDAYLQLSDPRHSCYKRPAIEDFGKKAKLEQTKAKTLKNLKEIFKDGTRSDKTALESENKG